MKIEITQHDIDSAVRSNSTKCPISLALNTDLRRRGINTRVVVGLTDFDYDYGFVVCNWSDNRPIDFVRNFDNGQAVAPATFYYRSR